MATFECTYAQLRAVAGEFIRAIPGADAASLEAGLHCVQLHYLGMRPAAKHEEAGAAALLRIVTREYLAAEQKLPAAPGRQA